MIRTVLVTGATGQLGRALVPMLRSAGHSIRMTSRAAAPSGMDADEWYVVDWVTGAGLDNALSGVDVVVHCASGSVKGERQTMAGLLAAVRTQPRPPHIVYISIVGIDRLPFSYYRAKLAAEKELSGSGVPHSILRATQFHSLVSAFVGALNRFPVVLLPKGVSFQPISLQPVAARLTDLAAGEPRGRVDDIGGPEVRTLRSLAVAHLAAVGRSKRVVEVPLPGAFMRALRAGWNLTPDHAVPGQTYEQYLTERRAPSLGS